MKFSRIIFTRRSSQVVVLIVLVIVTMAFYSRIHKYSKSEVTLLATRSSNCFDVGNSNVKTNVSNIFNLFRFNNSRTNDSKKCLDIDIRLSKLKSKNFFSDKTIFNVGRKVEHANCFELFKNNESEAKKAIEIDKNRKSVGPDKYSEMTTNCTSFIRSRNYIIESLTEEENEFPIAYSILMYKDIEQFERLLRAIYRPQNSYCVHVDLNSKEDVFKAVSAITKCFPNVYMAPIRVRVEWGGVTVLEPEFICMKELWIRSKLWKYFINLTGQEFPLKTNYELVKILSAYNGANDVNGTRKWAEPKRWKDAGKPPHEISPTKGSAHITVCRGFVEYVLFNPKALDLLKWVEKTFIPDETFFTCLNHNPHLKVPGSYTGTRVVVRLKEGEPSHFDDALTSYYDGDDDDDDKFEGLTSLLSSGGAAVSMGVYIEYTPTLTSTGQSGLDGDPDKDGKLFLTRFKKWQHIGDFVCKGKIVRDICILSVGNLPMLKDRKEMFANKFFWDYHRTAYECLEELHYNRTREQALGNLKFNASWYGALDFVWKKV